MIGPSISESFYEGASSTWSRSANGFAGLSNQGATCYMNSLLQTLFMTPDFRKGLYNWKYDEARDGEASQCIAYQLQLLFGHLQLGRRGSVGTRPLTTSFGWTSRDSFTQHDVQELNRVLFDALEVTLKGSGAGDIVNELYSGKYVDEIKCKECGKGGEQVVPFYDLQLAIRSFGGKRCSSVEESLDLFTEQELLSGSDQYNCETCGKKTDATKGLRLKELPRLLTLQIKRFDYDWNIDRRVKISDYLSFPLVLDMAKYVEGENKGDTGCGKIVTESERKDGSASGTSPAAMDVDTGNAGGGNPAGAGDGPAAEATGGHGAPAGDGCKMDVDVDATGSGSGGPGRHRYELFSVLIHSGGATGGHYFAYIRDFVSGKWFNFNDSNVTEITVEELERAFGDASTRPAPPPAPPAAAQAPPAHTQQAHSQPSQTSSSSDGASVPQAQAPVPQSQGGDDSVASSPPPAPPLVPSSYASISDYAAAASAAAAAAVDSYFGSGGAGSSSSSAAARTVSSSAATAYSSYRSTANAYMLVYRAIDPSFPTPSISEADVPAWVRAAVEADSATFEREAAAAKRAQDALQIKVFYGDLGSPASLMVESSKEEVLRDFVERARVATGLAEKGVAADCVRARNFVQYMGVPQESFEESMGKTMGELDFRGAKSMYLETRAPEETFRPILDREMALRVSRVDPATGQPAGTVHTVYMDSETSTVADLKVQLVAPFGIPAAEMRLIDGSMATPQVIGEDSLRLHEDCRLNNGDSVFIESIAEYPESLVIKEAERRRHNVVITFSRPASQVQAILERLRKEQQHQQQKEQEEKGHGKSEGQGGREGDGEGKAAAAEGMAEDIPAGAGAVVPGGGGSGASSGATVTFAPTAIEDLSVEIDKRLPLGELRKRIAEALGLPSTRIVLRRPYFQNFELRNDADPLSHFGIYNSCKLVVEEGRLLGPNEQWLNFYRCHLTEGPLTPHNHRHVLRHLFRLPVKETDTLDEVKVAIEAEMRSFAEAASSQASSSNVGEESKESNPHAGGSDSVSTSASGAVPSSPAPPSSEALLPLIPAAEMRLRELFSQRVGKIYHGSRTVKDVSPYAGEVKDLVVEHVQLTDVERAPAVPMQSILSYAAQRYHPLAEDDTANFSRRCELVLTSDASLSQLARVLAPLMGFTDEGSLADMVLVRAVGPNQLTATQLDSMTWHEVGPEDMGRLNSPPLSLFDGDIVVAASKAELEQAKVRVGSSSAAGPSPASYSRALVVVNDAGTSGTSSSTAATAKSSVSSYRRPAEVGIKIRVRDPTQQQQQQTQTHTQQEPAAQEGASPLVQSVQQQPGENEAQAQQGTEGEAARASSEQNTQREEETTMVDNEDIGEGAMALSEPDSPMMGTTSPLDTAMGSPRGSDPEDRDGAI